MGVLPNSQFGDVAVIDLGEGGSIPVGLGSGSGFYALANTNPIPNSTASCTVKPLVFPGSEIPANTPVTARISDLNSQFTVLVLRQAEALQRWKEISQSGDSDYREQIRKHFGVNLPQALSNMCTYIGGISRNLDISEVVNNNLAAEGDTAVIAAEVS